MKNTQPPKGNMWMANVLAVLFAAGSLLVLPGCRNLLEPSNAGSGTGTLLLTISGQGAERTIVPEMPNDLEFYLVFTAQSAGNTNFSQTGGSSSLAVELRAGTWKLDITASRSGHNVASGSLEFTVAAGGTVSGNVLLSPISGGAGTFSWDISFDANADIFQAVIILRPIVEGGSEWGGPNEELFFVYGASGDRAFPNPGSYAIPAGQYHLIFEVTNNQWETRKVHEILHIYRGMTSHFEKTVNIGHFPVTLLNHILSAWDNAAGEWNFYEAGIVAGHFSHLGINGVTDGNFGALVPLFNDLVVDPNGQGVPRFPDCLRAMVDAALILQRFPSGQIHPAGSSDQTQVMMYIIGLVRNGSLIAPTWAGDRVTLDVRNMYQVEIVFDGSIAEPVSYLASRIEQIQDDQQSGRVYIELSEDEIVLPQLLLFDVTPVTIVLRGDGDITVRLVPWFPSSLFSIHNGVTLELHDGITLQGVDGNHSALVVVAGGGTLIMNDGASITGNSNQWNGGGVSVNPNGHFIMNGGEIFGNSAGDGGGVHNDDGTFTMHGGRIHGNHATFLGGGVANTGDGIFQMSGGVIYGSDDGAPLMNTNNRGSASLSMSLANRAHFGTRSNGVFTQRGSFPSTDINTTIRVINGELDMANILFNLATNWEIQHWFWVDDPWEYTWPYLMRAGGDNQVDIRIADHQGRNALRVRAIENWAGFDLRHEGFNFQVGDVIRVAGISESSNQMLLNSDHEGWRPLGSAPFVSAGEAFVIEHTLTLADVAAIENTNPQTIRVRGNTANAVFTITDIMVVGPPRGPADSGWQAVIYSPYINPRSSTLTATPEGILVSNRGTGQHDHNNGLAFNLAGLRSLSDVANPDIVFTGTASAPGAMQTQGLDPNVNTSFSAGGTWTVTIPFSTALHADVSGGQLWGGPAPMLGTNQNQHFDYTVTGITIGGVDIRVLLAGDGTPTVTGVNVSPATAHLEKGGSETFTATVVGINNPSQDVTWAIDQAGRSPGTTISAGGVLTVASDEPLSVLTVRATSVADPTRSGTATVLFGRVVHRFDGRYGTRFANDNAPAGRVNGFDFEAWTDHRGAEGFVMYIYDDGSFFGTWNQTYNTLFRVGRRWPGQISSPDTFPTIEEVGDISVRQSTASFTSTRGATYLTLYGWVFDLQHHQIEWYIVESWRNWVPVDNNGSPRSGYTHQGTFTSNGATYDVVTGWRLGQPALTGQAVDFLQIFSVRRGSQLTGGDGALTSTINVTDHFNFWEANIGPQTSVNGTTIEFCSLARLYEVSWCVEGFGGTARSSGDGRVTALCIRYGPNRVCTNPSGCDHC